MTPEWCALYHLQGALVQGSGFRLRVHRSRSNSPNDYSEGLIPTVENDSTVGGDEGRIQEDGDALDSLTGAGDGSLQRYRLLR